MKQKKVTVGMICIQLTVIWKKFCFVCNMNLNVPKPNKPNLSFDNKKCEKLFLRILNSQSFKSILWIKPKSSLPTMINGGKGKQLDENCRSFPCSGDPQIYGDRILLFLPKYKIGIWAGLCFQPYKKKQFFKSKYYVRSK